MIVQSSGKPDFKLLVSGDVLTFRGIGTHAIPIQLEQIFENSQSYFTSEIKNSIEQGLSKNEVSFTRDEDQEEKKPSKGKNSQNEETNPLCLESMTYSSIVLVAKLEMVKVPDLLKSQFFEKFNLFDPAKSMHFGFQNCIPKFSHFKNSMHFGFQKSKYFAHFFEESKSQEISGDLSREKSQELNQSGKKFPEFDFYGQIKKSPQQLTNFEGVNHKSL